MLHQARLSQLVLLPAAGGHLAAAPGAPAKVPTIDASGYAALVASMKGHPLVVNMWATWCEPCREEFPDLVRFHSDFEGRGVELVSISMDTTSDLEDKVLPFLRSLNATFPAFIKAAGGDDEFINAIDPEWSGALPATFIYDASGRLARSVIGPTNHEELSRIVGPLVRAPGRED